METALIAEWMVSLSILAFFYWRSRRIAIGERGELVARFTQENSELKERSSQSELALKSQLVSLQSQIQVSKVTKAKLEREITELIQQCQRLREELKHQTTQIQTDAIIGGFEQIQTLLTQYPSVRRMVETQPDLPARNILALLISLENLLEFWDCQPIGKPWSIVAYDPQLHQGDADIQSDESVYVRFVGYQKGDRILIPAKVSRTLPTGVKS
jgi:hypothetical protein